MLYMSLSAYGFIPRYYFLCYHLTPYYNFHFRIYLTLFLIANSGANELKEQTVILLGIIQIMSLPELFYNIIWY